jgi:hypothetical protein
VTNVVKRRHLRSSLGFAVVACVLGLNSLLFDIDPLPIDDHPILCTLGYPSTIPYRVLTHLLQSQDCQKIHWPSHKAICQHTVSQLNQAKTGNGYVDENVGRNLRKFTSTHNALLGWAGFQALQLKRIPANVRQSALLIELGYRNHPESHRR